MMAEILGFRMVEPSGIEPLTSTMPLSTVRGKAPLVAGTEVVKKGTRMEQERISVPVGPKREQRMWYVPEDGPAPRAVQAIDSVGRVKPAGATVFRLSAQPAEPTCTFGEMVPLFQELFEPDPAKAPALLARTREVLRHSGLPKTGRRARQYTPADLRRLMIILELSSGGLAVVRAVALYEDHKALLEHSQMAEVVTITTGPRQCMNIDMAALRDAARRHLPRLFYGRGV